MSSSIVVGRLKQYAKDMGIRSGSFAIEPGRGSLESCGGVETSPCAAAELAISLRRLAVDLGIELMSCARSPYTVPRPVNRVEPDNKTPRATALWPAARQEVLAGGGSEEDADHMGQWNEFAATQMHIHVREMPIGVDSIDDRILFGINILNFTGPLVARILCDKYGVDNRGHLAINQRAADPRRFTRYGDWHPTFGDLKRSFESIPRLIKPVTTFNDHKTDAMYVIDLVARNDWTVAADHGTWWPFARPRPHNGPGTVELRILPSFPSEYLPDVLEDLAAFFFFAVVNAPGRPIRNIVDLMGHPVWRSIVRFQIGGKGCLPDPLTRASWMHAFLH